MLNVPNKVLARIERRAFNGKKYAYAFLSKKAVSQLINNGFFVEHYPDRVKSLYFIGWNNPKGKLAEYCNRISEGELDGIFNSKRVS